MLVAAGRAIECAFAGRHERVTRRIAADRLLEALPCKAQTALADNGTRFTEPTGDARSATDIERMPAAREPVRRHAFALACARNAIDHRLARPNHPWTNGPVERMNRTPEDATGRRRHAETHDMLRAHLTALLDAYTCAKRLKSLRGQTAFGFIHETWRSEPRRFTG